jgi:hypothetical protein
MMCSPVLSPVIYCSLVIPDVLQSKSSDQKEVSDKRRILQLSSRAYGHALRLAPNSSNIWHDLALSFIAQSKVSVTWLFACLLAHFCTMHVLDFYFCFVYCLAFVHLLYCKS